MKSLFIALAIATGFFCAGSAYAVNKPSEDVATRGTAELVSELSLDDEGVITIYSTAGITSDKFFLHEDHTFMMGAEPCGYPFAKGQTSQEYKIPLHVVSREKFIKWDLETMTTIDDPIGPVGEAVLTLPKGSNVFVCLVPGEPLKLQGIQIQTTDSEKKNVYDVVFPVEWK